jgi:hypothetical protein
MAWLGAAVTPSRSNKPMLYTILCYNSEKMVTSWTKEEDAAVMEKLIAV